MDPVSIAVSTVTLIQLASKVITLAVEYGKSVSTLPDEVQSLVSEIKLVSQVLTKLHDTLQDAPRNEEQNGLVVSKTDFLKPHMGECQEQLTVLATFLEKGQNRKARMRNFGKRLKWPMQVTETREWIMRMERFKGNCLLVLETEKLIVEKKLCSEMMEMRTAKEIQRIEREREKQIQDCRNAVAWLSVLDPRDNHDAARKLQQSGTGKWLTESSSFREWKSAEESFMWISGSAGTGKTILSSLVIDALTAEGDHKPIYFYCDFKDVAKMSSVGVYASLTAQIIAQKWSQELPAHFAEYYLQNRSLPLHESSLRRQLLLLIESMGRGRIIVDALDECSSDVRRDVLMTLVEIWQKGHINVLFTSREEIDIKLAVGSIQGPKTCIRVQASSTQSDMALFVNGEIEKQGTKLARLKESMKREIESTITSQANGMFRWAKCSLDYISRMRNDKSIKRALHSLPPGLNETYDRILASISEMDRAMAMRIFNWLTCSQRPLLIGEMVEGIAIELGSNNLDQDALLNDPEDVLDVCGSLVAVNNDTGTVVLGHFSVKEYLSSLGLRNGKYSEYFVDLRLTNFCLAKLCVTYLCFDDFTYGPSEAGAEYKERCQSHILYRYASYFWPKHAQEHVALDDDPFFSVMERFFLEPGMDGNFEAWKQVYHEGITKLHDRHHYSDRGPGSRLVYAARLGLYSIVHMLLLEGHDPNSVCEYKGPRQYHLPWNPGEANCGTPLIAATESGNIKVVELLLSKGADVNAEAEIAGSALNMAILHGERDNYTIMQYLLQHGADINLAPSGAMSPLAMAVDGRPSFDATKICLEAGADMDVNGLRTHTTLMESAAFSGSCQIFELLWEHGAGERVGSEFPSTCTPGINGYSLFHASWSNFFEIGQKILEKDGDKLFKDPTWKDPLLFVIRTCAGFGYYKFLEQLMVYAGTSSEWYTMALQDAAMMGHEKTVGMLLEIGTSESKRGSPLVPAAAAGSRKAVERLLEGGEDPSAVDEHGWSALLAATMYKQLEIIELFNNAGKYLAAGESAALPPTSWQISTMMLELQQIPCPNYEIDGGMAYCLPDNTHSYVMYTNHPIAPQSGFYYHEVKILEAGADFHFQLGLICALSQYQFRDTTTSTHRGFGERSLGYSDKGRIQARDTHSDDNPTFSVGSIIGCAVNLELGLAYFTCDGKLIDVPCVNVLGMIHPAVYLSPGTKIKANFGEEKFLFSTSILEGLDHGVEPAVRLETDEDEVEKTYSLRNPVKKFIG